MRVYVHDQVILIVGKAWEVLEQLRKSNKDYSSISEWIQSKL